MKNRLINIHILILLIFSFLNLVVAQQPKQYPKMTDEGVENMRKAYFFYLGQTYSIELFSRKFPELSTKLKTAQYNFDGVFGESVDNIDKILSIETFGWNELKTQFFNQIKQFADSSEQMTYSQALNNIESINNRAKGDIPSPYLETLLIYNPKFLKKPEQEFLGKYTNIFSTRKHPKSKGIDFQISYPKSWKANEGKRPNVITLIDSENGYGGEKLVIMVKELPIPETQKLTAADIKEFLSSNFVKEIVPPNATFVSSTPMKLDGLPTNSVIFDMEQKQLDFTIKSRFLFFVTLYKNKMILLQFGVSAFPGEEKELISRFIKFETLFKLMANSLIVNSQWK